MSRTQVVNSPGTDLIAQVKGTSWHCENIATPRGFAVDFSYGTMEKGMMTSNHIDVPSTDALAEPAVEPSAENANPLSHLFALFPSADQLRGMEAGAALVTSDRPDAGNLSASLDIPRALLNPLESLPHPMSVDDMKKLLHAATATTHNASLVGAKPPHPGEPYADV